MARRYNAFISYSQTADRQLVFKVKSALHRLAKPLFRLRALNIFLDQTDLAANPAMWPTIEAALADSEFLVLFASPQAAASPWVRKEVEWWLTNRSVDTLLLVLTDGGIVWKTGDADFNWAETTALPDNLRSRFTHTPKYVDLRYTKTHWCAV